MDEEGFLEAIEEKERKNEANSKAERDIEVEWGQWSGKSVFSWYRYSPLDECPRCSEYQSAYYTVDAGGLMGNKYLRGRYCRNCEYTDEVDKDPTRNLSDGGLLSSADY
jgi:hypothetical protein